MVPGSTLMYGSSLMRVTLRPRDSRIAAREAEAIPLPREDTTPPVTKTNLVMSIGRWAPGEVVKRDYKGGGGGARARPLVTLPAHERPRRQAHRPRAHGWDRVLQGRGAVPRAGEGRRDGAGRDDRGERAIHHAGDHAGAVEPPGLRLAMGPARAEQHAAHQPVAAGRRHPDRAVQRGL